MKEEGRSEGTPGFPSSVVACRSEAEIPLAGLRRTCDSLLRHGKQMRKVRLEKNRIANVMDTARANNPLLQEIVDCFKEYLGQHLISMVLFGSRARGDARGTSDYDILIITKGLPAKPFRRKLFIRTPLKGQFEEKLCIIAKTPDEVLSTFPSFFLDLSLDGIILLDRDQFFGNLQKKIKGIISQAGLRRKKHNGEYYWEWQKPPKGGWEITWSGYREL